MLIELYRIDMPLKKWYMRIVFYLIDMSISNAWLVYRRCNETYMPLRDFKLRIASSLMKANVRKRGRPSLDEDVPRKRNAVTVPRPSSDDRFNGFNHWPMHIDEKKRCRHCSSGFTRTQCSKCRMALCLNKNNNCFVDFHQQWLPICSSVSSYYCCDTLSVWFFLSQI